MIYKILFALLKCLPMPVYNLPLHSSLDRISPVQENLISPHIRICLSKIQESCNTTLTTCKRFGRQIHAAALKTAYFFRATGLKSLELLQRAFAWSKMQLKNLAVFLRDTTLLVGNAIKTIVQKIARFIQQNWKQLLCYLLAWTVIVVGTGLLYGFEAVALPLIIGLACGFGLGIMSGIMVAARSKHHDPENTSNGPNTLWNWLNRGLDLLDPNGTRLIMLSVAVTVIVATAVIFPYAIGGLIGFFIGNHIATKIGQDRNLGIDHYNINQQREELAHQLKIYKKEHDDLAVKLTNLETLHRNLFAPQP